MAYMYLRGHVTRRVLPHTPAPAAKDETTRQAAALRSLPAAAVVGGGRSLPAAAVTRGVVLRPEDVENLQRHS